MKLTCSVNYTRKAIYVCFGTLATQSLFSNTENGHPPMLWTVHNVADLFWQRSWAMTSPVTTTRSHEVECCLSFSISGLRNTDKRNESPTFRLPQNDNTEPTEQPAGRHKEPELSHRPSEIQLVVGRLTSWSAYSLNHENTSANVILLSPVDYLIGAKLTHLNPENMHDKTDDTWK